MTVNVIVENQSTPLVPKPAGLPNVVCVKQVHGACSSHITYGVYRGRAEDNGPELYTLEDRKTCQQGCATLPREMDIIADQQVIGRLTHVETECCARKTRHRLCTYTPAGEVPICDVAVQLPRCCSGLVVTANPYFTSAPSRFYLLTLLVILIIVVNIPNSTRALFSFDPVAGIIVSSFAGAGALALLITLLVKRGFTCCRVRWWKLLDLYNQGDNLLAAQISKVSRGFQPVGLLPVFQKVLSPSLRNRATERDGDSQTTYPHQHCHQNALDCP